ncbi:GNAT family N-acetyltransferase [Loktanella salsilacus]|jgi:RimJ/RimL family protein N-acetyltransferase|uniref:GNAT family N-acetyltransferase n=1 Tax=Loktanella salsilacus TaxID=195913 RepID=UPI0030022580
MLNTAPNLQTERLILRQPVAGDWAAFRDFMQSDRAAFFDHQGNIGSTWRSFAAELGHWDIFGYGMWAVTRRGDNTAIGLVGPWTPPDWPETEIGWMIFDPATEGTGIAAEAARAAITHAFDVLGWTTAVSYIHPGNIRSIGLAEKLGAVRDPAAPMPISYPDSAAWRHPAPQPGI